VAGVPGSRFPGSHLPGVTIIDLQLTGKKSFEGVLQKW